MPFNHPIPEHKPRTKLSTGIGALVEAEKLMQIAILLPSAAFIGWLAGAWADSRLALLGSFLAEFRGWFTWSGWHWPAPAIRPTKS